MTAKDSKRLTFIVLSFSLVTGLFWISEPRVAHAVDPDIPRLQAGADRGSIAQEIKLGAAYFMGDGVPRDEKLSAYWYEKAANAGDPGAQLQIGYFYQAGIGVPRDPAAAAKWFERSMAGGLIDAKVNLGVAYVWGQGVRKDPELGAQLFRQAADKGSGIGACYLGDVYYFGFGTPKDEAKAIHWYERGAKLHDPRAQFNLAIVLARKSTPEYAKAARLLRESAAAGYVPAKHELGLFIIRQPDLATSPREAMNLLEDAAAEGFWRSSLLLGVLARDGRGVAKDANAAYLHFRIAIMQGDDNTATLLANDIRKLSTELNEAQVKSLDQEATAWMQEHNHSFQYVPSNHRKHPDSPVFALEYPDKDVHAGRLIGIPATESGGQESGSVETGQKAGFAFR